MNEHRYFRADAVGEATVPGRRAGVQAHRAGEAVRSGHARDAASSSVPRPTSMGFNSRISSVMLPASDVAALGACAVLAWWIKSLADPSLPVAMYVQSLPILLGGAVLVYGALGSYPGIGRGPAEELRSVVLGTTIIALGFVAATFVGKRGEDWSRQIVSTTWAFALVLVPLARTAVRRTGWWGVPAIVLGAGATGEEVIRTLHRRPWLGLRPCAVLDDDPTKHGRTIDGVPVVGALHDLPSRSASGMRHGILAMPGMSAQELSRLLDTAATCLRHVFIVPAVPGSPDVIAVTREFANTLALEVQHNLLLPEACALKRVLDVVGVVIILLLFWWLMIAIILAVRFTSRGPVFYGQCRIGRDGVGFTAWKFRSMVEDADLQVHLAKSPELRAEWERDHKLRNDPRITLIGRILRRTSLDELPQLWNVLVGDMSLVGPRPIVEAEVTKYGERYPLYTKVRPGLSGLWQVSGRNDTTYTERVALDCYYVRNWSVWLDLVILARTVQVVLLGKGAY